MLPRRERYRKSVMCLNDYHTKIPETMKATIKNIIA